MVLYNFKSIQVVPGSRDFVDVVLSKTQRKTPTEVHKQYHISRIRSFYMRKVKFTQQSYHDKLSQIIQDFPLLDDIHPFYADLVNVLYDKDHYKLALGQLNTARNLIDNIAKDYLRLLKYGDSLYRCKQLKRAALGRMCTLMLKQNSSLAYLEQVRQHLARLPSIDPNTRTLLMCGYPNVGKSSFMNKMTRANVDVQPYAFTTKSLFVGHTDYKYNIWQVIDTPGILDHPLEERNTIEMQSITALAHLHAAVLFLIDISERCGYTIKQQVDLFFSIKALFLNKPLIVVINKIDVRRPEDVPADDWALIQSLTDPAKGGVGGTQILPMSTLTEEGVSKVKDVACTTLLADRIEKKMASSKISKDLHRLRTAQPKPRDEKVRSVFIPESVANARLADPDTLNKNKVTLTPGQMEVLQEEQDDLEYQKGIIPIFDINLWKRKYLLKDDSWKFDIIPEIMDGRNISDFIDPDILERLDELEREEEALIEELRANGGDASDESDLDDENQELLDEIHARKSEIKMDRLLGKTGRPKLTRQHKGLDKDHMERTLTRMGVEEEELGDIMDDVADKSRDRSKSRRPSERSLSRHGRKRDRSESRGVSVEGRGLSLNRSQSRGSSKTPAPVDGEGYRDLPQKEEAVMLGKEGMRKRNKLGYKGEGDHHIPNLMPKHLFAGKRGAGKTGRR